MLDKSYIEHPVFEQLSKYQRFYKDLSQSIMGFISQGTMSIISLDTFVFSSIQGTLDSISIILKNGRINDSFALLRKYYDSIIINIYTNLYLEDNFNLDNFIVEKIENWRIGKEKLPRTGIMLRYMNNSPKLSEINALISIDQTYEKIRERCNNHIHYNFFSYMLLNDNEIYNPNRIKYLNIIAKDLEELFIYHVSYLFYLSDHYLISSDYVDSLDLGLTPEPGSEYFVAPFIQEVFTNVIKRRRNDIAEIILTKTAMDLE